MNISRGSFIKKTAFTDYLLQQNGLDGCGFRKWMFHPGMLFNSDDTWWGRPGTRKRPHEGIDLLLFMDRQERVRRLGHAAKVPSAYDGVIVKIIDDFLGKSIFIEHPTTEKNNIRLCTFYGHTKPHSGLRIGDSVKEGDIIAALAGEDGPKSGVPPHLHISMGLAHRDIAVDHMNWDVIGDPGMITLLDPIQVMNLPYEMIEREFPLHSME